MSQQARVSSESAFPQEAFSYAGLYRLGQPVAVYRVALRQNIILGIIALLLGGVFAMVVISGESSGNSIIFMLILVLLCLAGGVYYLALHPLLHGSWRIYVYTDGWVFLKGNQAIPCRWDQVAFVWQRIIRYYRNGVYAGTSYKYTVQRADGVQMVLTNVFRNVNQLGDRIQSEVTSRLTPQALAAVRAGQTLPFGRFSINWQGLATPKEVIPWSEAPQVSIGSGWVTIQRRGQRKGTPYGKVDSIPNLYVFLKVADALAKGQAR
ncbi:MAG TPA: DUF6585 family protein [Ktedonobacterales bacterium]